jgi:hypothetical protein
LSRCRLTTHSRGCPGSSVYGSAVTQGRLEGHRALRPFLAPLPDKVPKANEREAELGFRPRPDLGGDGVRGLQHVPCGVGHPREMFRLGSATTENAEAGAVGNRTQQGGRERDEFAGPVRHGCECFASPRRPRPPIRFASTVRRPRVASFAGRWHTEEDVDAGARSGRAPRGERRRACG